MQDTFRWMGGWTGLEVRRGGLDGQLRVCLCVWIGRAVGCGEATRRDEGFPPFCWRR